MPSPATHRSPPPRDPALDGLRGVAILLVFLFHYGGGLRSHNVAVRAFGCLTQAGWAGVELFFVLSGFLITGLLWGELDRPHALRHFYGRRALRILPVYLGALAAAAAAALLHGAHPAALRPLLIYLAFVQNIPALVPAALRYPPPLPLNHLWSLAVEEQFYLLWPLVLLGAGGRRRALHLSLWSFVLCGLARVLLFSHGLLPGIDPSHWAASLPVRGSGLALGAALALSVPVPVRGAADERLVAAEPPRVHRWAWLLLLAAMAVYVAVGARSGDLLLAQPVQFVFSLPAVQVAAAAVLLLCTQAGLLRGALSFAPLRFMGRISYGFYVLHILLEPLFDRLGRNLAHAASGSAYQGTRMVAAFVVTTAAATLSFALYERPFLRLKRYLQP